MGELYSLIPSQQNIYTLVKYSFHKQIVQIPASISMDSDFDFITLNKALNIEVERNDSMRLRFKKVDGEIKQFFVDNYRIKSVPVFSFATEKEQYEFFTKDAHKPIRFLDGETYRICFFTSYNGHKGIYFNVTHLAMDAMGMLLFFADLIAVYKALKEHTDMPAPLYRYEDYIKSELVKATDEQKLEKGKQFYLEYFAKGGEPYYAAVHGPEFLQKARARTHNPGLRVPEAYSPRYDKTDMLQLHISKEDSQKIFDFCVEKKIAPEALFILGMRTYCSKINYRTPDVFQNLMCSKRLNYKDMRTGGCMAQTLQVRTIIPEEFTFSQALDEVLSVRMKLFRHLSYPFTYARGILMQMYNHKVVQGVASHMISWLPVDPSLFCGHKCEFRTYNLGRYFNPLYAICNPEPNGDGIVITYMYRKKLVSEKNVKSLHENAVNIILKGIENRDITVKELLDSVER